MTSENTNKRRDRETFQDLILALQHYWADKGCVVLQPYDMPMGAGTFHAATFLRSIGPEPWAAAYVQPSRRPSDGRYGDNPLGLWLMAASSADSARIRSRPALPK